MSQDDREMIHPSGPSILPGSALYLLNSNDLLINFTVSTPESDSGLCGRAVCSLFAQLDIAYVIPSQLNIADLRVSLARTLALFPLFCGRLLREPQWAVGLILRYTLQASN